MHRVAITTAVDRVERLAVTARSHGLDPIALPCIEVAPAPEVDLTRSRELAGAADWILVTSSRAIDVLWPDGGVPNAPVAAVGPATAEAATRAGGKVALIGDGDAGALVDELAVQARAKTVFFPHASGANLSRVTTLEEAGSRVDSIAVYETHSVPPGPDQVDAVMFGSPSAVAGWQMARSLDGLVLAAMGETTASALEDAGHHADVVPPNPDFDLLISRLAEFLRERSPV